METSIKVSPYGTLFQCCTTPSARFIEVLELSFQYVSEVEVGRGFAGETFIMVSPYGTLFQCCTSSSGQVRRSLLSISPLLYKCSIGRWRGCASCCCIWWLLAEFRL